MGFFKKIFSKLSESSDDNSEKGTDANESHQNDSITSSVSSPEAINNKGKEEADVSVMTEDQQVSTQENSQKEENMPTPEKVVGLVENAPAQDSPKSSQPESHEDGVLSISDLEKLKRKAWEKVRQARSENDPRESEYYARYRKIHRVVKKGEEISLKELENMIGKIDISAIEEVSHSNTEPIEEEETHVNTDEPLKDLENVHGKIDNSAVEEVSDSKDIEPIKEDEANDKTENDFSERLEKLIAVALQDGILTDKEKEIIRRRAEKEGEDPDEVEMIVEARLAETILNKDVAEKQHAATEEQRNAVEESSHSTNSNLSQHDFQNDCEFDGDEKSINCLFYKCYSNLVLPDSVESIESFAFDRSELKRIKLPKGLRLIGNNAFQLCSRLELVDMSECFHLEAIRQEAFYHCDNLEIIDLSNCLQLEEIEKETFRCCTNLKRVILPPNLKKIGRLAFFGCEELEEIDFSQCTQLEVIEEQAFNECKKMKHIILPPNLKRIDDWAFLHCESVENLEISQCKQLYEIGVAAFGDCFSLKEVILPESLAKCDKNAFQECYSLECVDMSQCLKLEEIEELTFMDCRSLKDVKFSSNLRSIGPKAFLHCISLRSLVIPDSVEKVSTGIILGCSHIKSITLPQKLQDIENLDENESVPLRDLDMSHCTELRDISECIGSFSRIKELIIPNGVETIDTDWLIGGELLENVYFPKTLKSLEIENVFFNTYCYSPKLESLEVFDDTDDKNDPDYVALTVYVLPEYLDAYIQQAEAEGIKAHFEAIPEDKLYLYDN